MIYAWVDKDGNEILMTPEEAREANRDFGLTDLDQEFIRAIEAGEIDGDVELLDDDGNIIREPRTPDEASQIEPTDQPVTLPFSGPKS